MRRLGLAVLPFLACLALGAEEYADTHPPAGVTLERQGGARAFEASVPGELLDWAFLTDSRGGSLYLLAAPEDAEPPRNALYRADLDTLALIPITTDLPTDFDSLATLDTNGDGTLELLIGEPGRIFRFDHLDSVDKVAWSRIASAPGLDLSAALDPPDAAGAARKMTLPAVGRLRTLGPTENGWGLAARQPLPIRAAPHRWGLRLTTPRSTPLGPAEGDLVAIGPEAVGHRRLRSLLRPSADSESAEREVWSRLPGPESLQQSWFLVLDGRPVLAVTTNSADKLGILERQRFRLFSLYGDRTQAGVGPWLAERTTSRRWQRVEPFVGDLDGDGDEDLVVAQVDGLGSGKTRLEAFINSGRRGFEPARRESTLDRPPMAWSFGADLTGDGLPDFALLSEGSLEVYATLPAGSRRVVERRPRWSFVGSDIPRGEHSVTLGTGGVAVTDDRPVLDSAPRVLDLDGDGRPELLVAENPSWGFGRLRVVFLPPL